MTSILSNALGKIGFNHDTDELICEILIEITKALSASSSTFWQYDKLTGILELQITCLSTEGTPRIIQEAPAAEIPTSFSVKKYRTTRKLYFEEKPFVQVIDLKDPDLSDHGEWLQSLGVKAVLQLPVIFLKDFLGWIPVHSCLSEDPWSENEIKLASEMASELAIGLRIKDLAEQAKYAAVLKERANFAREIHDTLAQALMGILIQAEAAEEFYGKDEKFFKKHLDEVRKLAKQSLREARRSIHALRNLDDIGDNLLTMIRKAVVSSYDEEPVYIEQNGTFPNLLNEARYEVYRIVNEALSNAVRHAEATEIKVMLSSDPYLSIQVVDNGCGLSLAGEEKTHYGLEIMQERAHKIGAEVKISSRQGSGTTVEIVIPPALVIDQGVEKYGKN